MNRNKCKMCGANLDVYYMSYMGLRAILASRVKISSRAIYEVCPYHTHFLLCKDDENTYYLASLDLDWCYCFYYYSLNDDKSFFEYYKKDHFNNIEAKPIKHTFDGEIKLDENFVETFIIYR